MGSWRKFISATIKLVIAPLLFLYPVSVDSQTMDQKPVEKAGYQSGREAWLKRYNESQDHAKRQQAMENLRTEWAKYRDQHDRFLPWRIVFPEDNQRRLRLPNSIREEDARKLLREAKKEGVIKKLEEAKDKEREEARKQMMLRENERKFIQPPHLRHLGGVFLFQLNPPAEGSGLILNKKIDTESNSRGY